MADSFELPFRHLQGDTEEILESVKTQCLLVNIWSQGTCIRSSSATRSTSTNTAASEAVPALFLGRAGYTTWQNDSNILLGDLTTFVDSYN